jgi:membrane associated rhomboid family serine protease
MAPGSARPIVDLLVAFLVVFASQIVLTLFGLVNLLFVLSPPITAEPWTVVTSVYAHASPWHLLSNAVALVLFGYPVARATTRVRFHGFFIVTGALAGIAQIAVTNLVATIPLVGVDPAVGVLGASGAVFALLGYLLTSNPLSTGLGSRIDAPPWVTLLIFAVVAGVLTFLTASPGAALVAHFTGIVLGLAAGAANLLAVSTDPSGPQPDRI